MPLWRCPFSVGGPGLSSAVMSQSVESVSPGFRPQLCHLLMTDLGQRATLLF